MHSTFATLLNRLKGPDLERSGIIPWASPIPAFGDLAGAQLATVGLNPSNREFVNSSGDELEGRARRFHTLTSLQLPDWSQADARHIRLMLESCSLYFYRNPYDSWFKRLDYLLADTTFSFYNSQACHLDLIPYATAAKWTSLSATQRCTLMANSTDALALLLGDSMIQILVLNGRSVVAKFEEMTDAHLTRKEMPEWSLPRHTGSDVVGISYFGLIEGLRDIAFAQPILVLGYNHNIQSSFGVTRKVVDAISSWVSTEVRKHHNAASRQRSR